MLKAFLFIAFVLLDVQGVMSSVQVGLLDWNSDPFESKCRVPVYDKACEARKVAAQEPIQPRFKWDNSLAQGRIIWLKERPVISLSEWDDAHAYSLILKYKPYAIDEVAKHEKWWLPIVEKMMNASREVSIKIHSNDLDKVFFSFEGLTDDEASYHRRQIGMRY